MRQVQVRLDDEEIERLDKWAEDLRASGAPGTSRATRSDLIREAVQAKLREWQPPPTPKGKATRR